MNLLRVSTISPVKRTEFQMAKFTSRVDFLSKCLCWSYYELVYILVSPDRFNCVLIGCVSPCPRYVILPHTPLNPPIHIRLKELTLVKCPHIYNQVVGHVKCIRLE